ncbi:peptidyl-prolyl cis-trans isomerase-like 6 [Arapaima gigas]
MSSADEGDPISDSLDNLIDDDVDKDLLLSKPIQSTDTEEQIKMLDNYLGNKNQLAAMEDLDVMPDMLFCLKENLEEGDRTPERGGYAAMEGSRLEVVGLAKEQSFQVAACAAEELKEKFPSCFGDPVIHPLLEFDWLVYLNNKKQELKGEVWEFKGSVMCFNNGRLLGDERDLTSWAEKQCGFTLSRTQEQCLTLAQELYCRQLRKTGATVLTSGSQSPSLQHTFVYMDVEIDGEPAGRLVFQLFLELCPKTCKNFEALCTGERGLLPSDTPLSYKGSVFHRVVPNGWVQGGDISPGSRGNGGESIYGPTFEDESFAVSHNKRGILGMANAGPHSNGSQFYITLQPLPWMDRNYVAFGQTIEGSEVLKRMETISTRNERPVQLCKIVDCGLFLP